MALRVMLVEDTVGAPMVKVLNKWGYEVSLAVDGEEAWKQANETTFDCFLIDWMLPGMSGIDLVQKLRQLERCNGKPIVMISGRSEKTDIATALQAGIDSYLAKPFTAVQLRDKIKEVITARAKRADGEQRIQRIVQGHMSFNKIDVTPFIIFGEPASTNTELKKWAHVVDYLGGAVDAIDKANQQHNALALGYVIATSADEVIQYVKSQVTRHRICAVLLSVDFKGNALRLTRLLSANRSQSEFAVFLVCNSANDIPLAQQADLEELGVHIAERSDFSERGWQRLLEEYAVDSSEEEEDPDDDD